MTGTVRRWPLVLIAAPAAVAIWSGWVGLGGLCGFGPVRVLPGITGLTVNTAITLPVGVEAYAAYALGAWMSPASPPGARRFARWSALGALAYGMAGQIIYHLLAAAHAVQAPWPVVVVVSCMPVAVLGLAAGLTHLLRANRVNHTVPEDAGPGLSDPPRSPGPAQPANDLEPTTQDRVPARVPLPSYRQVREEYKCGPSTAKKIRAGMAAAVKAAQNGHVPEGD